MSEENKAIARRFLEEGFNTGDPTVADEIIDPNFSYHDPGTPPLPSGPEGFNQLLSMYHEAFPDIHVTIEDLIAEGDKVVVRWTGGGTNTGEMMGMPPTGKAFKVTGVNTFRISGGKVVDTWVSFDTLGMMQQLGIVPTPG